MGDSTNTTAQTKELADCPPLERSIVNFIQDLRFDQLDSGVKAAVSLLMRDQIAVQIGSSAMPWSKLVLSYVDQRKRDGHSRIGASNLKMSAADAVYVNASYGHGFEYDDAHSESASHPGCCVVPVALAIGEELDLPMEDVITAIVVGYEVYTRIGCLAAPDLLSRGFHPHAVLARFGAAAVAAKLRGLDAETTLHALAIALSHASGVTEFSSTGGSIKRVHAGIGASGGMAAADLAAAGITGPRAFLSGNKGFFRTFLQRTAGENPDKWFGKDAEFQIKKVWLKPYCCCGCNHAYIDSMAEFIGKAAEVVAITLRIQRSANMAVGTANVNSYTPRNIEHIQYSLPVQMAFALHGLGNGYKVHRDYLAGKVEMDAILETARKVVIEEDPTLDAKYPGKFIADVTITFRDGSSRHVLIENSSGTTENPLSDAQQDAKFFDLTDSALGNERTRALLSALRTLDPHVPARTITAMWSL